MYTRITVTNRYCDAYTLLVMLNIWEGCMYDLCCYAVAVPHTSLLSPGQLSVSIVVHRFKNLYIVPGE